MSALLRKYNAATTINFELFEIDGVDLRVDAVHVAGDTKIMKDEGVEANTGSGFVDEGQGYSIALTATEMTAARIVLYVVDAATKVWLDRTIVIETYGNAAAQHEFDLDTASTPQTGDSFARLGVAGAGLTDLGGMSTGMQAEIEKEADDALVAQNLDHLVGTAAGIPTIVPGTYIDQMQDDGTATYDRTTDSLQAVRDRGDAAWTTGAGGTPPQLLQSTTIATLASQTSFTLTAGSADDNAYNNAIAVITDSATATQKAVGRVSDYTGSTKTVTLDADPGIFTMAIGDTIEIIANSTQLSNLDVLVSSRTQPEVATNIATLASQVSFTLDSGSPDDDAYNGWTCIITDVTNAAQKAVGLISDYTGSSLTVTLEIDPGIFTMAVGDFIQIEAQRVGAETITPAGATKAGTGVISDATPFPGASITEVRLAELAAANLPTDVANVQSDTDDIQTRLPAALVGGRMDSSVGAMATSVMTAAALATDAVAKVADGVWDEDIVAAHATADTAGLLVALLMKKALPTNWVTDVVADSALDQMADDGTAVYDRTTDSLQAIRDRGDAAWTTGGGGANPFLLQNTTIATLTSQTSFTLTAGSADNDAYNDSWIVITDSATATQKAVGVVTDYTGATKTVTLLFDPAVFTMAVGDTVDVLATRSSLASVCTEARLAELDTANLPTDVANVQSDTDDIQTRLPAALVSGRMDSSVGAMITAVLTADALATDAAEEIADALLDRVAGIETGFTPRQALRLILAALVGKLSGAATTNILIRDVNDTKDRINATVDASGNRTAVTKDTT